MAEPERKVLFCPVCRAQHVDCLEWAVRPHKRHLCARCGYEWRPFDFCTVGVLLTPEERTCRYCHEGKCCEGGAYYRCPDCGGTGLNLPEELVRTILRADIGFDVSRPKVIYNG